MYETIVGLEIHSELLTESKMYCSCKNEFGLEPNTNCCPICMGMPGTLPRVNKRAVEFAIRAGLALNCKISQHTRMDRKNYYYPDLVKGYQITQDETPICEGGYIEIETKNGAKKIHLERIHIEEDTGKSTHLGDESLLDYNRCGVPLIEIVTKPEISTSEEARLFMESLRSILKYIGVSDGKMEEGALRCDANVNLKIIDNGVEFRTPISEIKNMNSFKAVKDACTYEVSRQLEEYNSKDRIAFKTGFKRTMGWDEPSGQTIVQRTKTIAEDYRFMPEPDLRALELSDKFIKEVSDSVGELPEAKRLRFKKEYHLSEFDVQTLTSERELAEWFEQAAKKSSSPKKCANWILAEVLAVLNETNSSLSDLKFGPDAIAELVNVIEEGKITSKQAKDVFAEMIACGKKPSAVIAEKGMEQVSDSSFIEKIVEEVFAENAEAVQDWKNGKTNVAGWLMGQVMKKSGGKANPKQAADLVNKRLAQ